MRQDALSALVARARAEDESLGLPVLREGVARLACAAIREKGRETMLEVGTCRGLSALIFLSCGIRSLVTIEKDESRLSVARRRFAECDASESVRTILGDCRAVLPALVGTRYDAVFLDGPKSDLFAQFELCLPLIGVGGLIAIDDARFSVAPGAKPRTLVRRVAEATERILRDPRVKSTVFDVDGGLLLAEKIRD